MPGSKRTASSRCCSIGDCGEGQGEGDVQDEGCSDGWVVGARAVMVVQGLGGL